MKLLEPIRLGKRTAPNRVMFGPHETNLGWGRQVSERHAAYYARRAAGGAGVIVIEEASVHESDWPYERCPSAAESGSGWTNVAEACRAAGDGLILAALGHSGGQGSSAFHQRELWAPSDEQEIINREIPKIMELEDIVSVAGSFGTAARLAVEAGLDGVEVNAGQYSLIRQFLSGLTNRRSDGYGQDRERFAREVLTAVRSGLGPDAVLGLRFSADELAPWAGITPEAAAGIAVRLAPFVDYITVVRGSIFSAGETRPTLHSEPGFNREVCTTVRSALRHEGIQTPVFLQGSIVEISMAEEALTSEISDGVEMTRAQLADPDLVAKVDAGNSHRIRPCVLCNQWCQVRDNRNPIVSCVVNPRAGHELIDPPLQPGGAESSDVLVVGAGPAGLEAARIAALRGHNVRIVEQADEPGGMLNVFASGYAQRRFSDLKAWLVDECIEAGVSMYTTGVVDATHLESWQGDIVLATGSVPAPPTFEIDGNAVAVTAAEALADLGALPPGDVVIWDPVGRMTGVAIAEALADRDGDVIFVTPDGIVGTFLSLTGDLGGANVRLQQQGVKIIRRHIIRSADSEGVELEHVNTGERMRVSAQVVIDAGGRHSNDALWPARTSRTSRVGDAVAARTVGDAIREGRAAGMAIGTGAP